MRRLAWLIGALAASLVGLLGSASHAADVDRPSGRSVSYSFWTLEGSTVRVRVVLPTSVTRRLSAQGAPPGITAVSAAVASNLGVSAGARNCEAVDQGEGVGQVYTLALTPGLDRFEMIFRCPAAESLVLHDHLLFARAPDYVDYALIKRVGGSALNLFTGSRQDLALPSAPMADAGISEFAVQGFWRRLTTPEGLCIVAGLLILSRRWRDLAFIAGGLGAGYAVSLAISVVGIVAADPTLTETAVDVALLVLGAGAVYRQWKGDEIDKRWRIGAAAVGAGLALVALIAAVLVSPAAGFVAGGVLLFGLALIVGAEGDPRSGWLISALAALFSLLDGLRPANDLQPLHLQGLRLIPMLAGYDLGGAVAALGIAGLAMALLWLSARKIVFARPLAEDLSSAGLLGLGVFWFVRRIYSL